MERAGLVLAAAVVVGGCGTQVYEGDPPAASYTYYQDAKPILDASCVECHRADPSSEAIPLETYAQAYLFRDVVAESVLDGSMPPRRDHEPGLSDDDARALVGWATEGGLMGDPGVDVGGTE